MHRNLDVVRHVVVIARVVIRHHHVEGFLGRGVHAARATRRARRGEDGVVRLGLRRVRAVDDGARRQRRVVLARDGASQAHALPVVEQRLLGGGLWREHGGSKHGT